MGIEIITKYFKLTPRQTEQMEALGRLYPEWNDKINVVSRKDIDNLYEHHILHSLAIAKFLQPKAGTTFLDMGTGGGFPGIPLAIMWPDCTFHLIDRIGKKIRVAEDISKQIGLTNVTFQHGDIGECRQRYDFVVSRAVMRLDELIPLVKKNITPGGKNGYPNGIIVLKGGDLNSELSSLRCPIIEESLGTWFKEEFFDTKKLVYAQI
jgi:16S rRNA (guanine527-N7)-methyltransferase